jgi:hypothetical protein
MRHSPEFHRSRIATHGTRVAALARGCDPSKTIFRVKINAQPFS